MSTLAPGADFGPFRIIEKLGKGGMASAYKAYEPGLDRHVALKVLPPELNEEGFEPRFQREAKTIARLEHPNIVPIFAFGIEAGIPWMSMRLVGGGAPSSHLGEGLPPVEIVRIVTSVADASTTPTPAVSCTATSSRRTSCSTTTDASTWRTSGSPAWSRAATA